MKKIKSSLVVAILLPVLLVLAISGCNKKFERLLTPHTDTTTYVVQQPKVLYLIIDGAVGTEIQNINPFGINQLSKNAVYSWNALADYNSYVDPTYTDGEGWANMMTGVTRSKHRVADNTFSGNNLAEYPSFIKMIKRDADYKGKFIAAFSASPDFNNYFSDSADIHSTLPTDDAVKSAVVKVLDTSSKVDVVVGQFHSVAAAGAANGYTSSVPEYNTAIVHIDSCIQSIMTALKSRPTYSKEKWLVVLASNKGSDTATWKGADTKFQDSRRNTFVFFYSPTYGSTYVGQPNTGITFTGVAPQLTNSNNPGNPQAQATTDNGFFNFNANTGKEYTVEFKIKILNPGSFNYPTLFSKRAKFAAANNGWLFFCQGNYWGINMSNGSGNVQTLASSANINDGAWHTLTGEFYNEPSDAGKRYVKAYNDGVYTGKVNIEDRKDLMNSTAPLAIGALAGDGGNPNFLITSIKVFNVALPDSVVQKNFKKTGVVGHPYLSNVIGYWPCLDGKGSALTDESGFGHDFTLTGGYTWNSFSDTDPLRLSPDVNTSTYRQVPNSVDIPYMILSWLNAKKPNWDLSGYPWTPNTFVAN
ncbi:LamG-like jellyroll fold domain-containing protein [Pinibacter aurantiacus]|uniref:DUF4983 domain-containing protein n=1 Tax=Pinibacter aurantiacus TaxID=2851599 RepID=A0A9E2SEH5_9BACT|nr:LamG-like jellyroll fold domain-containing protein [Pinibacter aurantiacus]MBV4359908.1 DUF4983 domain-containing protein [Pinibacter aurantiacus]